MKRYSHEFMIILTVHAFVTFDVCCQRYGSNGQFPKLQGRLLGQEPPGTSLKPFLPEIFSVNGMFKFHLNSGLLFSPDGDEVYFTDQDTTT